MRRDIDGEEDFAVRLTVEPQPGLPDPRAQLLKIDLNEPLTAALFVRGLPMQVSRSLKLGNVLLSLTWADSQVTITDYLDTYQRSDGTFEPFFVSRQGMKFQTAPESGEAFVLQPGDQLLCGDEIHEVRKA